MKLISTLLVVIAIFAVACGGGGDDSSSTGSSSNGGSKSGVVIAAANADQVAHDALPTLQDLPGQGWSITSQDDFSSSSGPGFEEMIQGTPECSTLQNLTTLKSLFGGEDTEEKAPIGQAQVEFEKQDASSLIPTSVDLEVKIDESASGSSAQFTIVKNLFESADTSNCLITVLNNQFKESGPAGVEIQVKKGTGSATTPEDGARMAFDIDMSVAGVDLQLAMQLYFWPYGNANVQAMFLGTNDTLTSDLVGGVLKTVDDNLKTAAKD